jgi:hypothetical protein
VCIPLTETIRIIKHWDIHRFGNRYFENLNAEEEVPGTPTSTFCCRISSLMGIKFLQVVIVGSTLPRWVTNERQERGANSNFSSSSSSPVARFQCLASTCRMAFMAFPHSKGSTAARCSHTELHAVMESGVYPPLWFHLPPLLIVLCHARH